MEGKESTETPNEQKHVNNAPRIYVSSLADYNSGYYLGRWIDADQPADVIREAITEMLSQSKQPVAEEWAIHDFANFGDLSLSESEDIDCVADVARGIVEHGVVFGGLVSHLGGASNVADARRYMLDGYYGAFNSLAEYAESLVDGLYSDAVEQLPQFIRSHIDYDGIGRDLELGGDVFTIELEGQVHVFASTL